MKRITVMAQARNHDLQNTPIIFTRVLILASKANVLGMRLLRFALVIVMVWIESVKLANYEADGIVPLSRTAL